MRLSLTELKALMFIVAEYEAGAKPEVSEPERINRTVKTIVANRALRKLLKAQGEPKP